MSYPSIHDHIPPLETGGIIARDGFLFQDHVAAQYCIQMLTDRDLKEVRCESQDDITLVWGDQGSNYIEFVQVKGNRLDQLWSLAKVCEQDGKIGSSIIERLFANDRFNEDARFRIVTRRDVKKELSILKLPLTSPSRTSSEAKHRTLCEGVTKKHPNLTSGKGNDISYFISQTCWEVAHSTESLSEKNRGALRDYLENKGVYLIGSKIGTIYQEVLGQVQDAACADWNVNPDSKKILFEDFLQWIDRTIKTVQDAASTSASEVLREKMEDASLSSDDITTAINMLQFYREESLSSRYFDPTDRDMVEREIWAELNELRSKFDSGEISESNIAFHARCLSKLKELQKELPVGTEPRLHYLQGCMYYISGRCGHRFRRLYS